MPKNDKELADYLEEAIGQAVKEGRTEGWQKPARDRPVARDFYVWGSRKRDWGSLIIFLGGLTILVAFGILGWQCLFWLRNGAWHPVPVWFLWLDMGLPYPALNWVGVQKIAVWILEQSLAAFTWLCGVALVWLGLSIED